MPSSFTTVRSCAWACSARPPVSVWGTGGPAPRVEAFLGASGSPCFPGPIGPGHRRASPPPSKAAARICLGGGPRAWTGRAIRPAGPPLRVTPVNTLAYLRGGSPDPRRPAPARPEDRDAGAYTGGAGRGSAPARRHGRYPVRYGNINPSSIDYARRPRLRSRLTQGGLAWPWNPWSRGAGASHPSIATHACILTPAPSTPGHPAASPGAGRSPTTRRAPPPPRGGGADGGGSAASAARLSPAQLSAHDHLTSELLRTLSRMAASEPTSWLSPRPHILSHLARA